MDCSKKGLDWFKKIGFEFWILPTSESEWPPKLVLEWNKKAMTAEGEEKRPSANIQPWPCLTLNLTAFQFHEDFSEDHAARSISLCD